MPVIQWEESLSVGDPAMDLHHRHLLGLLERLYRVLHGPDSAPVVGEVLGEMMAYVDYHFSEEERRMEAVGFPGLEDHRLSHAALTGAVLSLKAEYDAEPGFVMAAELFEFLSEWLLRHIKTEDMAYKPWMVRSH